MSKLNKQQWQHLRKELGLYRSVYLLVDGIPIALTEQRDGQRIVVMTYISGWSCGWWREDHFFTKYHREVKKSVYSKKELDRWYKIWKTLDGKKAADERKKKAFFTYRTPVFPSLKNLQWHMNKVAESIEILDKDSYNRISKKYEEDNPEYFKKPEATDG